MKFIKRNLTLSEAKSLQPAIKQSKHIISFDPQKWQKFEQVFVAQSIHGEFIAACALTNIRGYYKLGPLVVRGEYQGQSIGKKLITHIIEQYPSQSFILGSSNPKAVAIAQKLGFKPAKNSHVFLSFKLYLINYLWSNLSLSYLKEAFIKKFIGKRGRYKVFLKK